LATKKLSDRAREWLTRLQDSGYRLTGPRRAIVQILADSEHTLSPTQVFLAARNTDANIGLVTVYRTLDKLEELGLIQRVHENNGCHTYIAAPIGHQHLLICQDCNRAEYFAGEDLGPLMARLGTERGYRINDHWLQLFGTCPDCQAKKHS
jgi:Fur family ferric uptake transcriptional regulator